MKKIFFAGSFNPFTKGHADIVRRLLDIADEVIIGLGINRDKPGSSEGVREKAGEILTWVSRESLDGRVRVCIYDGLTGEEALKEGACCLARGVRNSTDFEYEYSLAAMNRDAFGIDTILLPADPAYAYLSSSALRDLEANRHSELASKYRP